MSAKVKFPDHAWAGDEYGHACKECPQHSDWWCDRVAHNLGETERALRLLAAVEGRIDLETPGVRYAPIKETLGDSE